MEIINRLVRLALSPRGLSIWLGALWLVAGSCKPDYGPRTHGPYLRGKNQDSKTRRIGDTRSSPTPTTSPIIEPPPSPLPTVTPIQSPVVTPSPQPPPPPPPPPTPSITPSPTTTPVVLNCNMTANPAAVALGDEVEIHFVAAGDVDTADIDGQQVDPTGDVLTIVIGTAPQQTVTATVRAVTGEQHQCQVDVQVVEPDPEPLLEVCASLPAAGFQGYPSRCPEDQAVVVINDGKSEALSCCPLSPGVLSTENPHTQRQHLCGADEVLTGMNSRENANPIQVLCTKINTDFFQLTPSVKSQHRRAGDFPGGSPMNALLRRYRIHDACVCPQPGMVIVGGHSWQDNRCEDRCVTIERKTP